MSQFYLETISKKMNTTKKYLLFILIIIVFINNSKAQDASFSQYYSSSLYLNPAMAGMEPTVAFLSNYRQQWRSIVMPYITSQVSIIHPITNPTGGRNLHIGGVGLSLLNDLAGDGNFKTNGVNANGAYNLYFTQEENQILTFGLQVGVIQKRIDYSNLQWGEQYNPYIGFDATINPEVGVNSGTTYADIGAGVIYNYVGFKKAINPVTGFVGFSAYHLNAPNESFYTSMVAKLPRLYKAHGGINILIGDKFKISPNVLFMYQGGRMLFNSGLYATFNLYEKDENIKTLLPSELIFGVWHRLKDSFIFSVGVNNETYTFAMSYDVNSSNMRSYTQGRGAFEVSLSLRKARDKRFKRFNTPRI
ncbi:MAG: type IX secretion system membrane protein PorP/SprF [Cytophagales bacterium]|nr:MAG: type IX secretion system membrane protein PorP/SprF [Cytophagales bacterium]